MKLVEAEALKPRVHEIRNSSTDLATLRWLPAFGSMAYATNHHLVHPRSQEGAKLGSVRLLGER